LGIGIHGEAPRRFGEQIDQEKASSVEKVLGKKEQQEVQKVVRPRNWTALR